MAIQKPTILKGKNKATQETINIILGSIANGLTQRESAILAGISEDTLSLWKRQDSDFSEQIRQKQIENKLRHINIINKASEKDWRASTWWLERKYPDEFSPNSKIKLETNVQLDELTKDIKKILTPLI